MMLDFPADGWLKAAVEMNINSLAIRDQRGLLPQRKPGGQWPQVLMVAR